MSSVNAVRICMAESPAFLEEGRPLQAVGSWQSLTAQLMATDGRDSITTKRVKHRTHLKSLEPGKVVLA